MTTIDKFVDLKITRETSRIRTSSFDTPMVLIKSPVLAEDGTVRVETYSNPDEVGVAFGVASKAYKIAQKLFGQDGSSNTIKIGLIYSDETIIEGLIQVRTVDDDWYALVTETHVASDVLLLAEYIQSQNKIYGTSSSDPTANTATETDIGKLLQDKGCTRTFVVAANDADTDYPEAAIIGSQLSATPGSNTWNLKRATGVTPLKALSYTNLEKKNYNYFSDLAGLVVFADGKMAAGDWIDEIIFVDWLKATMQESVIFRMVNKKKIAMTRGGVTVVESEIRQVLQRGVTNGGIADDTPIIVISPDPLTDISELQRNQRIMGTFKFRVRLAGAAHNVVIRGEVYA